MSVELERDRQGHFSSDSTSTLSSWLKWRHTSDYFFCIFFQGANTFGFNRNGCIAALLPVGSHYNIASTRHGRRLRCFYVRDSSVSFNDKLHSDGALHTTLDSDSRITDMPRYVLHHSSIATRELRHLFSYDEVVVLSLCSRFCLHLLLSMKYIYMFDGAVINALQLFLLLDIMLSIMQKK